MITFFDWALTVIKILLKRANIMINQIFRRSEAIIFIKQFLFFRMFQLAGIILPYQKHR